jgi:hypothetical protein
VAPLELSVPFGPAASETAEAPPPAAGWLLGLRRRLFGS